jgi:hypothetical protein
MYTRAAKQCEHARTAWQIHIPFHNLNLENMIGQYPLTLSFSRTRIGKFQPPTSKKTYREPIPLSIDVLSSLHVMQDVFTVFPKFLEEQTSINMAGQSTSEKNRALR